MLLKEMKVRNFKGIKMLSIDFGNVTTIKAANGIGKSSVFDAYLWVVTGVDSYGRTKFNVRPIGSTDDISVTVCIKTDTGKVELNRVQKLVDGKNKNVYSIDGFEIKEKDYFAKVREIVGCEVDTIKALSSPSLFASSHWTAQRRLIMRLVSEVPDEEVADKDLLLLLKDHTQEEIAKKYDRQAKDIKKKLAEIPIRIDENERMKPSGMDKRIEELRKEQRELSQEIANCERILFLCESYRVAKCKAVTEKINKCFPKGVEVALFDDAGKEKCEITMQSVPYNVLSTGQRIRVGLTVLTRLHTALGVELPMWIDNAESLSGKLPEQTQQTVWLSVARFKKLNVVTI